MRRLGPILLLLLIPAPAVARETRTVHVRLLERWGLQEAGFRESDHGPYRAIAARSGYLVEGGRPGASLRFGESTGTWWIRFQGRERQYPGVVTARASGDRLVLDDEVPLEDYVASVVTSELPADWPMESLKAQAVLARTLAVKGGDHPDGSLCDLTHCQVFSGDRSAQGRQVALATRGLILTYGGLPVTGLYHSTCAGARASNQAIFGGRAVSYLQGGPDPFCQASPHARPWRAIVSRAELAAALGVPSVEAIVLLDRTPGGWVTRLSVDGQRMTGYRFWQAIGRHLGWGELKSLRFMVRREGDRFVFTGIGLGHGVGLCQWGARGRAIAGRDYRRVLAAYFPGTQLKAI